MDSVNWFGPDYKKIKKLGSGGFGSVYLAQDLKLERQVAIKVLSSVFTDDNDREHCLKEARLMAQLDHQAIVKVHALQIESEPYYIVMEYVKGCTLAEKEKEQQSHPPQGEELDKRLAFFRKVLDGVKYAHDHNVIHRDLKPANIMVTESGDPKILDFGIARRESTNSLPSMSIRGTYGYLAPEHLDGEIKFGKTTDMFALGIILYELVTGRSPYKSKKEADILKQLNNDNSFEMPSTVNPAISSQLDYIIARLTEKDPQKRYQSVDELLQDWGIKHQYRADLFGPDYKKIRKLGSGGFGSVYLAQDCKLERQVAIKVLSVFADDNDKEHCLKEARLMAKLDHQAIVKVHALQIESEPYYIVMEYVKGCTLAEMEKEQQSHPPRGEELDKRLAFFRKVLDGVKYAHDHKVIHRDLKPANIMVTESGDPKILDFGIARRESTNSLPSMSIRGTYGYLAPEYLNGEITGGKLTDMFALGIILYELITGRSPYKSKNVGAIQWQLANDKSFEEPSKVNPAISSQLDYIIARLTEKDPQKRYQSVDELLEDWDKLNSGEKVPPLQFRAASLLKNKSFRKKLLNIPMGLLLACSFLAPVYNNLKPLIYPTPSPTVKTGSSPSLSSGESTPTPEVLSVEAENALKSCMWEANMNLGCAERAFDAYGQALEQMRSYCERPQEGSKEMRDITIKGMKQDLERARTQIKEAMEELKSDSAHEDDLKLLPQINKDTYLSLVPQARGDMEAMLKRMDLFVRILDDDLPAHTYLNTLNKLEKSAELSGQQLFLTYNKIFIGFDRQYLNESLTKLMPTFLHLVPVNQQWSEDPNVLASQEARGKAELKSLDSDILAEIGDM